MLVYSVIMFLGAALFSALGIAVYKGKTDLIHQYHQTKVQDKTAYGRAFGKALFIFALAMLFSGITGLFAGTNLIGGVAVAVLLTGICVGIICLVKVQNKYNSGVF